jgi:hypothetical protein
MYSQNNDNLKEPSTRALGLRQEDASSYVSSHNIIMEVNQSFRNSNVTEHTKNQIYVSNKKEQIQNYLK